MVCFLITNLVINFDMSSLEVVNHWLIS